MTILWKQALHFLTHHFASSMRSHFPTKQAFYEVLSKMPSIALRTMPTALVLVAAALAPPVTAEFTGDGTAYVLNPPSGGNCNFMSWPTAAASNYAAMNLEQWDHGNACGRCVEAWCDDSRCTSKHSAVVLVMDHCYECNKGDLDLSPSVFKMITGSDPSRLKIKWKFVDCPAPGNINVCLKKGSNGFWTAVQPTNMVVGVKGMSINGNVAELISGAFYYKVETPGGADLSKLQVSVTSITGQVVSGEVSLSEGQCAPLSGQFRGGGGVTKSSPVLDGADDLPRTVTPSDPRLDQDVGMQA